MLDLKVMHVEPALLQPPGEANATLVGAEQSHYPLAPLLWELAMRGLRRELLPEITGPAVYRVAPGLEIDSLPASGALTYLGATQWAADGAKMTRQALNQAFGQIATLLPRALALTDADVLAMNAKDKPKGVAGGFGGRVQESASGGTLLWSFGFISVQPLS